MTTHLRLAVPWFLSVALAACHNDPNIGKACTKKEDCGGDLICDVHDGKGTCQEPHGHEGGEEGAETGHATDPTTGGSTTTTTGAATAATEGSAGTTAAPDIGDPCAVDADCGPDLICDVHDGTGTCQAPHDHAQG